ncbi:hypothetical protein HPHPP2B_0691 [Helicobacter pylori Hp P-2b]|uniref:Uncharacterized protein n=1 Tax=Helicobacter pylori Hp P-2 TaxID=992073 RepID=J0PN06_HELPX|nr:hypothetical protein HPHPP2_0687 [Helicobacter pylori Hp P-2]EJC57907.1 hypothetical protein HPHPP2B_0691 [Helicobacter pylori Hp P-2b]
MRESYLRELKKEGSSYPYLIETELIFIISFLTSHRFF